jgi:beta-glucanase (GH16 family)
MRADILRVRYISTAAVPLVLALVGVTAAGASTHAAHHAQVTWRLIWSDNFAGSRGSGVNQRTWRYETGQGIFGTGEIETMTNSTANVALDGMGDLLINAINTRGSWTSGRIRTISTFAAPARGEMMVTASIKQPAPVQGLGYWPAFWLLGPGPWPANGEIDIMEDVNALSLHSGTLHCGNLTQHNPDGTTGPCHEYTGLTSGLQPCSQCQAGYHTYSVVIDRRNPSNEQIQWYLDGQQFYAVTEQQLGPAVWSQAVDHGFSIIFDLAIGGGYPNALCGCTTPTTLTSPSGTMAVHGVAVYTSP